MPVVLQAPVAQTAPRRTVLTMQDQGKPTPVPTELALPLAKRTIVLAGLAAESSVYLPVNPGLRPAALEIYLETSPLLPKGYFSVLNEGRPLKEVVLSPGKHVLRVPLAKARTQNGILALTFRSRFEGEDVCAGQSLYAVRILPESRIHLQGVPQIPKTIAEFFPPYLKKVVVYLPEPTPAAADMVLWLSAYLSRRYPGRPLAFSLKPFTSWEQIEYGPWKRSIVWRPSEGAHLVGLQEGMALVLGTRAEAARLFLANPGLSSAVFPAEATKTIELQSPYEVGPTRSLAQLGYGPQTVRGVGTLSAYYSFALADFGPYTHPIGMRLRVIHTPVKGRAYLELILNGTPFDTLGLEGTKLDAWVSMPANLLERNNTLELRFTYSPQEGACPRGALPFSATVDPRSFFTLSEGQLLQGFDALPQSFLPKFTVYLEPLDLFKLGMAARLVYHLQATTRTPLWPQIGGLEARPLMAIGGPALPKRLKAPLRTPGFRLVDGQSRTWLEVYPGTPYAALQAFSQGGGTVLLLSHTSSDGRLLDRFLRNLLADGWFNLHGDIAIGGIGGSYMVFRLQKSGLRIKPLPEPAPSLYARHRREFYLLLAVAAFFLLIWLYPKVVRRA